MAWQWPFPAYLCVVTMNMEKAGASQSAVAERRDSAFPLLKLLAPPPGRIVGNQCQKALEGMLLMVLL